MRSRNKLPRRAYTGFTLVEILVALLVLSIGLLGLAALQLTSFQFNTDSYLRTQTTFSAYDIIDRLRVNPTGLDNGDYDVASSTDADTIVSNYQACSGSGGACNCDGASASCDASDLALYDLGRWYTKMDQILPGAKAKRATITRTAGNLIDIEIFWTERDVDKSLVWQVQL
jgi:type IV pilus assembly protein PilV